MRRIPPTVRARWCDRGQVSSLVADSLHNAAIGAWLVPEHDQRRDVLTAVAHIWVEHALLFGEAYLLADRSAAAVWLHRYRPIPPPTSYRQRLAAACGDHLDRFRCLDRILKVHRPAEAHNHLAFLAVPPAAGCVTRTSGLLASCLVRMDRLALPSYAEAMTAAETAIYVRHGYNARELFLLPDGTPVHQLSRRPAAQRPAPTVNTSHIRTGPVWGRTRVTAL
ncbi:hypothetical protein ACTWLT_15215 [Micromonospora sp. ZYX-F-536]|uniref:hypothetical protein n=1 Tax=Micromonospora sp. ZYX-F-536 TaxID=3457629 RepID=UPI004040CA5A